MHLFGVSWYDVFAKFIQPLNRSLPSNSIGNLDDVTLFSLGG